MLQLRNLLFLSTHNLWVGDYIPTRLPKTLFLFTQDVLRSTHRKQEGRQQEMGQRHQQAVGQWEERTGSKGKAACLPKTIEKNGLNRKHMKWESDQKPVNRWEDVIVKTEMTHRQLTSWKCFSSYVPWVSSLTGCLLLFCFCFPRQRCVVVLAVLRLTL